VELDTDMIEILKERVENDWYGRDISSVSIDTTQTTKHYKLHSASNEENEDGTSMLLSIHHQDILRFTPEYEQYSVIANIPYYITSPILFHFLYDVALSPEEMTIMMQKEVGEKILE
jgi:16S rRNA A1518/A1519 N6-dimethyltransferase RsmA/KsgA/DIM1 with predicted DNA glycosylase/AP lyase activity